MYIENCVRPNKNVWFPSYLVQQIGCSSWPLPKSFLMGRETSLTMFSENLYVFKEFCCVENLYAI
jgi:hypothetical protein